ncbi:MAG: HAD family hydrolase [Myxococcota bacterium]
MPSPTALLLDMDGVLVDSKSVHHNAWRALFEPFGVDFTREDFETTALGVSRDTVIRSVLGPDVDLQALMDKKAALVHDLLAAEGCAEIPGAHALLDEIHRRKIPVCLATSSRMPDPFLRAAGLLDALPHRVDRTQTQRGKPAPDIFVLAAKTLAHPPARCVVVEDSPAGVTAARAAGCAVVGLTSNHGPDALKGCDQVITALHAFWPVWDRAVAEGGMPTE